MKSTGDSKAVAKGSSNGDVQKLGKPAPKEGPMRFLDKAQVGSARGVLSKK